MEFIPIPGSISDTFLASFRSVGTGVTLAAVGVYLHRTGLIRSDGTKTLALLSQQVTSPLFLFTKIIFCRQDGSDKPCPDVTSSITSAWMLLWWPAYVVAVGLASGWLVARVCRTPKHQMRSVLAACAFGNSAGLPITLLKVIHENVPADSDLGRVDPTLFLSVFLLLYPALQWGLGGWLLEPVSSTQVPVQIVTRMSETISENGIESDHAEEIPLVVATSTRLRNQSQSLTKESSMWFDSTLNRMIRHVLERCFQPPVLGALAGMLVAILPGARGIFVDLDRRNSAPLQFLFDGLYVVGETAVPINMLVLGSNLSSSLQQSNRSHEMHLSMASMVGIVVAKMILGPMIGIGSAVVLKTYVWDIPNDIKSAFYLVLMIVFLTPTASNVIVMVELSGSDAKEGIARTIALQYLVAPLILSATMTIAIGVASGWS